MTAAIIRAMGTSLLSTIFLELAFAVMAGIKGKRSLTVTVLANTLTNPIVTCTYYFFRYALMLSKGALIPVIVILETAAVLTEWRVYKSCTDIKKPLLLSLGANCFSYFTGVIVNML